MSAPFGGRIGAEVLAALGCSPHGALFEAAGHQCDPFTPTSERATRAA